ncbi:receptor-like protein 35 [Pistacia vera]|uniref:receptor-like protein 35 n=1 Tax=Pistacia vera TaxID=55513 RepID=UPI001263D88D|nr:receptor-like protein 35 [Pistacia vera]
MVEILDLSNNRLSGIIPECMGNFSSLRVLDLRKNRFYGSIPGTFAEGNHYTLDLGNKKINDTFPYWLGNLLELRVLVLCSNKFYGSIRDCSKTNKCFPKLRIFDLSNNSFSNFLPTLYFKNLEAMMDVGEDERELEYMGEDYYQDSAILTWKGHEIQLGRIITTCTTIDFSNNYFHGKIPRVIGNLHALRLLNLSHNNLSGCIPSGNIPDHIFRSPNLQFLSLRGNLNLTGVFPKGQIPIPPPYLTIFSLSNNELTGEIPHLTCNMSMVEILDLSYNRLSGIIPECMGNFSSLHVLDLRKNRFYGSIPGTFDLGNNKINDTFPYWLGNLPELRVLVLHSNKFYGSIRDCSKTNKCFPNLRIFDFSNNSFNGFLPTPYFKNLEAMIDVGEDERELKHFREGDYKDSVTMTVKRHEIQLVQTITTFTTIDFSNNYFHGEIPGVIGNLHSLRFLNLSHNNLSGCIPSSLGNSTALEYLDLSSNKLVGKILRSLLNCSKLELLDLGNNKVNDTFPYWLGNLPELRVLILRSNKLIGIIPECKGNFSSLHVLDLQKNRFYGSIPGTFGEGNHYRMLNFNDNGLEGPVPRSLLNCSKLEKCGTDDGKPQPPSTLEDDAESSSGFGWKVVLMGYGCGMVLGVTMGYLVFSTGKPQWVVRIVEGGHPRKGRRLKNKCGGR